MEITIKANNKITKAKIQKDKNGEIYSITFDFEPSAMWSDIEMWMFDSKTDKYLDYAKMNISKRQKMQFYKR